MSNLLVNHFVCALLKSDSHVNVKIQREKKRKQQLNPLFVIFATLILIILYLSFCSFCVLPFFVLFFYSKRLGETYLFVYYDDKKHFDDNIFGNFIQTPHLKTSTFCFAQFPATCWISRLHFCSPLASHNSAAILF